MNNSVECEPFSWYEVTWCQVGKLISPASMSPFSGSSTQHRESQRLWCRRCSTTGRASQEKASGSTLSQKLVKIMNGTVQQYLRNREVIVHHSSSSSSPWLNPTDWTDPARDGLVARFQIPFLHPACDAKSGRQVTVAKSLVLPSLSSTSPEMPTLTKAEKESEENKNVGQRKGIGCERPPHSSFFYKEDEGRLLGLVELVGSFPMAIQEKLMQAVVEHRAQLALAAALAAAVVSLLSVGPSFSAVAGFFWPLLVSTAFLLVAVAVLLRISPPPGETSGEELIDYVAGRPEDAQLAAPYEETPDAGREGEVETERVKHQKSQ
ncbi:hypothetical protein GW17_00025908 [Ensete ventricosum]|nr:hypothetical protein GW17_00025908 [Ensete ventricosum]RZS00572.1 hypothetical protein BHM03_00030301 [Ensete ventricosum]